MKEIINEKLYDTETAIEIVSWWNECCSENLITEHLYQKKTGDLFLHAIGGPFTPYGYFTEYSGYNMGEHIIPLSDEDAKKWLAKHSFVDEYIQLFGQVAE